MTLSSTPDLGTVRTSYGRLRMAADSDAVRVFRGIPYAAPPVGGLRWRPARPPASWEGVRPCDRFGPTAPQFPLVANSLYVGGADDTSEDCLTLNVWTPAVSPEERLPVIVWFHFGAFQFGGSSLPLYDGRRLAARGVIVVTVNYRLGTLGFLAHPALSAESDTGVSGNWGITDQIAALRWVRDEIAAFGGDPERVTIMGLSAGGASVGLLLASPGAGGLFQRAIAMSGALMSPPGVSSERSDRMQTLAAAEASGRELGGRLGAGTAEELRSLPIRSLLTQGHDAQPVPDPEGWILEAAGGIPVPSGAFDNAYPIVDGAVIPAPPIDIFRRRQQAPVPLITGSAADEAAGLPHLVDLARYEQHLRGYGRLAGELGRAFPALGDDEVPRQSARLLADRVFIWQNWTLARLHARAGLPTYYYHSHGHPPVPEGTAEREPGAYHGWEIPYIFGSFDAKPWGWTEDDFALSERLAGYFTAFAATGDPNHGDRSPLWPSFEDERSALWIGDGIRLGEVPRRDVLDVWDRYFLDAALS